MKIAHYAIIMTFSHWQLLNISRQLFSYLQTYISMSALIATPFESHNVMGGWKINEELAYDHNRYTFIHNTWRPSIHEHENNELDLQMYSQ